MKNNMTLTIVKKDGTTEKHQGFYLTSDRYAIAIAINVGTWEMPTTQYLYFALENILWWQVEMTK